MRLLLCAVLVGGALGHYRSYEERDIALTDEEGNQYVRCPVCGNGSDPWENDECLREDYPVEWKDGVRYKKCLYGTYRNDKCGNRLDCYRGEGEPCTEHMDFDKLGMKCRAGYTCQRLTHLCEGPRAPSHIRPLTMLNQERRYGGPLQQRAAFNWNDFIRVRRQA